MGKISKCRDHHGAILEAVRRGEPGKQIARRLGVSYGSLRAYVARHGLALRAFQEHGGRWIPVDENHLRSLLAEGRTREQIAIILGVETWTIDRRCQRLGLSTGRTGPLAGHLHPEWKGGRRLDKHGYIYVWCPMHPRASHGGCVFEHRLVMEVKLGRYLGPKEVPHHMDDHPRHNWPDNLGLYASNADHLRDELAGKYASSRRWSIPGGYGNTQKNLPCPDEHETLAQCSSEFHQKLAYYIESHRPTSAHRSLNRKELRTLSAHRDPFPGA